jgi:hypothetical protein
MRSKNSTVQLVVNREHAAFRLTLLTKLRTDSADVDSRYGECQ